MTTDDKTDVRDTPVPPSTSAEPPKIYIPACGVLCDVFWWARRDPPAEQQEAPDSSPGKKS